MHCAKLYSTLQHSTMHCNALDTAVQESLFEVGVKQVGEGGSPDLEEAMHLTLTLKPGNNLRRKLDSICLEQQTKKTTHCASLGKPSFKK